MIMEEHHFSRIGAGRKLWLMPLAQETLEEQGRAANSGGLFLVMEDDEGRFDILAEAATEAHGLELLDLVRAA